MGGGMGKDGGMETGNSHGLNGRNGLKRIFLWDEVLGEDSSPQRSKGRKDFWRRGFSGENRMFKDGERRLRMERKKCGRDTAGTRRGLPSRAERGPAPPYQGGQFFSCVPAALKCCDARFFKGDSYFFLRLGSDSLTGMSDRFAWERGVAPCCNPQGFQPWNSAGRIFRKRRQKRGGNVRRRALPG